MAQSKEFFTRIQHKHDIETNWIKAVNFIPLAGEIIVYDKDEKHEYERMKIGDGVSKVNDLLFADDNKMNKINPSGSGSFSLNRTANSTIGDYSTAIGYNNIASGYAAYAEGVRTTAEGSWSHAEGEGTVAAGNCSHVQGKYNLIDANNKFAHIVGNGVDYNDRSNAHTLDWDGNAWYQGDVYVGGTSQDNGTKLVKSTDVIPIANGGTGQTSIVDTVYTAPRYRASALVSTETTPTSNGVITWTYE